MQAMQCLTDGRAAQSEIGADACLLQKLARQILSGNDLFFQNGVCLISHCSWRVKGPTALSARR